MPTEQAAAPKLKTNLDTDLLRLIAILMLIFYLCRNRPALGTDTWRTPNPCLWRDTPSTGPSSGCCPYSPFICLPIPASKFQSCFSMASTPSILRRLALSA